MIAIVSWRRNTLCKKMIRGTGLSRVPAQRATPTRRHPRTSPPRRPSRLPAATSDTRRGRQPTPAVLFTPLTPLALGARRRGGLSLVGRRGGDRLAVPDRNRWRNIQRRAALP